jgi:hypothetical protein
VQQRDFDEFCELLDIVAEQYGKPMTEGLKMLYWQGLCEFDLAAVRVALSRHLKNTDSGMFMPKIADVIKMLQGTTQDSALLAWAKVDKAVRMIGTGMSVVFDDPLIHRVLHDMGGWMGLGTKTTDEWPFVAKEFENRYRGFKMRNEIPEYLPVMIGLYEAGNNKDGFKTDTPILVGDHVAAARVMKGGTRKPSIGFTPAPEELARSVKALTERRDVAA